MELHKSKGPGAHNFEEFRCTVDSSSCDTAKCADILATERMQELSGKPGLSSIYIIPKGTRCMIARPREVEKCKRTVTIYWSVSRADDT